MAAGETYEEFVEKFNPKKTTDDCYTPPLVYDAVANWVANEYGISREKFVRPFFPGGDYENYDYSGGAIVVDNPPFSILSKILDFYISNNIKFFLFANNLTLFSSVRDRNCTAMIVDTNVIYENGANVKTSFVTNLESRDLRFRVAPSLHQTVKNAVDLTRKQVVKSIPKYSYPSNVAQTARLGPFARYGIEIRVKKSESIFISRLDSQKSTKKAIFGGAYLVSEECAKKIRKGRTGKGRTGKGRTIPVKRKRKRNYKKVRREIIMAILTPDKITTLGGVTVKEYLLTKHNPNHIDMPTALMTGKVLGVTIHNTDRIKTAAGTTPAEQYTRATVNGNMKTVRVHYYVDSTCAWQNLPLSLSGWHAADGSGNGNRRTIAIECIMNGSGDAADKRAEENAARLAAALLKQHGLGINHLYTHTHWLNVRDGRNGTVDQLNTMHNSYKMCPAYILPHWAAFKAKVQTYLNNASAAKPAASTALRYDWKRGQAVRLYKTRTQLFSSDTATKAANTLPAGVYYIYDGKQCKLGRFRITTRKAYCGKTPAGKYVTGYVSVDNFREV